jgi:hypothetical protein
MDAVKILVFGFVAVAGLIYLVGIVYAIIHTKKGTPSEMPGYLDHMITTIGGVLATNLGAVLGIKFAEGSNLLSLKMSATIPPDIGTFQIIVAFLYFFCMIAAGITWASKKFTPDPEIVVPALPRLSKTLAGVAVGALALAVGITL